MSLTKHMPDELPVSYLVDKLDSERETQVMLPSARELISRANVILPKGSKALSVELTSRGMLICYELTLYGKLRKLIKGITGKCRQRASQ